MNLEKENERPRQRNKPEKLQNIIIKDLRFNIKSAEYEYQLGFRSEDKDKP